MDKAELIQRDAMRVTKLRDLCICRKRRHEQSAGKKEEQKEEKHTERRSTTEFFLKMQKTIIIALGHTSDLDKTTVARWGHLHPLLF